MTFKDSSFLSALIFKDIFEMQDCFVYWICLSRKVMKKIYMFKRLIIFYIILLIWICFPIVAKAEIKIGYVDTSLVMQKAPQAESAARKIEKEFSPRDSKLGRQQKEITKLEDKLAHDGDIMSDKEKRNLIRQIRLLKREQRRLREEFREEFTMRRNELQNEITLIIIKTIRSVAKEEDYDLIIDAAIYVGKRVDITNRVISRLKEEFKNK